MAASHRDEPRLRRPFEVMLLIRAFEPETERQHNAAKIDGYYHLGFDAPCQGQPVSR